jgi:hypothetical protein
VAGDDGVDGTVNGHHFAANGSSGNGSPGTVPPFLTSYTSKVRDLHIRDLEISGTAPTWILYFQFLPATADPFAVTNSVGPIQYGAIGQSYLTTPSNNPLVRVVDQFEQFHYSTLPQGHPGGGNAAGFIGCYTAATPTTNKSTGATTTTITDALGGSNAVEVTYAASSDFVYYNLTGAVATLPLWIEFDLKPGTLTPLAFLDVVGAASGATRYQRRIPIPATGGWVGYRFPMWKLDALNQLHFRPSTAAGSVQLGRVRAYHAREPLPMDLTLPAAEVVTTAPVAGAGAALPATPAGYVTVYINGVAQRIAYY